MAGRQPPLRFCNMTLAKSCVLVSRRASVRYQIMRHSGLTASGVKVLPNDTLESTNAGQRIFAISGGPHESLPSRRICLPDNDVAQATGKRSIGNLG